MDYIDKMLKIIEKQFVSIMANDPDFYSQYKIVLSNEQQYIKNKDRDPKAIYIVVKFMAGSINFGQILYPVNFNALGEGNKLEVAQKLLLEYAQTFNLGEEEKWEDVQLGKEHLTLNTNNKYVYNNQEYTLQQLKELNLVDFKIDNYVAKQVYTQPQVMSNFNAAWNEFRTLFFMTGTFLIGKNSMPITGIRYYESMDATEESGIDVDFIATSWDFTIQLDSQAFYGTDSRTTSKSKIGTLSFSMTSYAADNLLCNKVRAIAFNNKTIAPNGIKESFWFKLIFADPTFTIGTETNGRMEFHLANATSPQNIGELPLIALTFTN